MSPALRKVDYGDHCWIHTGHFSSCVRVKRSLLNNLGMAAGVIGVMLFQDIINFSNYYV
jgi:hypothetical protein